MAWRRRNQEYFLCGDGQAQARLCENNFFQRDVGIDTIFPAILDVLLVQWSVGVEFRLKFFPPILSSGVDEEMIIIYSDE